MFSDDYKNEMDKIKPDGFIKYKVRQRLAEKEGKPSNKRVYFGRAVAAVLCLCLVFTAGTILGRYTAPNIASVENTGILETTNDYDKIYSALAAFKPTIFDKIKDYATGYKNIDAEDEYLYEYAEESIDMEASTATNDSAVGDKGAEAYSQTTTQVDGVDEADIVKTDGKHIYILSNQNGKDTIKIVEIGTNPKRLSNIEISADFYASDMYLSDDRLVVLCGVNGKSEITALLYDISNPSNPKELQSCTQSGYLNTSRLIGNKLYVISNFYVNVNDMIKSDTSSYVPYINCGEYDDSVLPETVCFLNECKSPQYTVISAFNINDSTLISTQSVLGGTQTVYSSTNNIIIAGISVNSKTQVARFKIQDGIIELKASAEINGSLLNQFSIDEYKDHFRFVLTETKVVKEGAVTDNGSTVMKTIDETVTVNSLVILDSNLKETGKITDIAPDERVYSVRFMGDTAYFVTFRQVDPLFSVDVSDPENPIIIGALKIPGFSNYLFPYGEGKLLGIGQNADEITGRTGSMKLSMFDISNPSNVTENDKTDIPAVYSEALYNHKAVLADYSRNIIAFSANGVYTSNCFFVYSYENGEFVKKLETEITNTNICRGIYVGKIFYIVTDKNIIYYDIASFEQLGEIELN